MRKPGLSSVFESFFGQTTTFVFTIAFSHRTLDFESLGAFKDQKFGGVFLLHIAYQFFFL